MTALILPRCILSICGNSNPDRAKLSVLFDNMRWKRASCWNAKRRRVHVQQLCRICTTSRQPEPCTNWQNSYELCNFRCWLHRSCRAWRKHSIGIIDNESKISYLITQIKRRSSSDCSCKILIILINLRAHPSHLAAAGCRRLVYDCF